MTSGSADNPRTEGGSRGNAKLWKGLQFAAAVGLCVLGTALLLRSNAEGTAYPDEPGDRELFLCKDDGHAFERTPRELFTAAKEAGGLPMGTTVCPQCHKPTARRAERRDGKVVALPPPEMERIFQPPGGSSR